ncbi:FG-GAP repeat domain-containing protein [Streptomyces sp. NPDC052396]|uniref:FG-GAP repeat domain-containing protein n=1 Tax=Streptomyces sp. NPDC052396 TaxID=3365689 RepID=UPI0037CDF2F6
MSNLRRGRALSRLVTSAVAVTLAGATAGTAMADSGNAPLAAAARQSLPTAGAAAKAGAEPTGSAPQLTIDAVNDKGEFFFYEPDGKGGLKPRKAGKNTKSSKAAWKHMKMVTQVHDRWGLHSGFLFLEDDNNVYFASDAGSYKVGNNWRQYDTFFSPGDLGGSKDSDVITRDKSGVLWLYEGDIIGKVGARKKIGGGWNQFTQIVGRGDLTGDGKTDIVARDKQGVLWLYKGTGNANKPFAGRTKISGGWNQYTKLVSTGDVDGDGHSDLLAVDKKGALWLYKGTGKASSPFKSPVKISNSGWNNYRLVF